MANQIVHRVLEDVVKPFGDTEIDERVRHPHRPLLGIANQDQKDISDPTRFPDDAIGNELRQFEGREFQGSLQNELIH